MKLVFNLGILMIALYLAMDAAIASEDGVERPLVQLIAGMGVLVMLWYCLVNGLKRMRITRVWSFSVWWLAFYGVLLLYFVLGFLDIPSSLASGSPRYNFVALYIVLTTFFIYYGVVNNHLTEGRFLLVLTLLFIGGLVDLYDAVTNPREKLGVDVINTSSGYVFVMLMPALMYKYRDQAVWVFLLTLCLTAIAGKRGALIIYSVLLLYSLVNFQSILRSSKLNLKTIMALALACFSAVYFFDVAYESLQHRLDTFVDPRQGSLGSGRDLLWLNLYKHWGEGDLAHMVFGSGYYSTLSVVGLLAHNDFIQYLVDYGIFGLSVYLCFLIALARNIRAVKAVDSYIYYLLMVCFIVLLGRGLFAGTIRTDQIYWAVSVGYLLGLATVKKYAVKT